MSGHAVGQGQASLGSSPLPLAAFPGSDQSEANRGGHPDSNPAEGRTVQHPTQLRPQTRVRTRTRMAGKDGRMRWTVQMHFQVFGIIQDQPFLPTPSSSLCLGSWSLCFPISIGCPGSWGPTASRQRRRQGTSQLSSPTCLETGLSVLILSHPHSQCPQPPPPGILPSNQADGYYS